MDLHYLPGSGVRADWLPGRGYTIIRWRRIGARTVVLGQITMHSVAKDHFVCAYDDDGAKACSTSFTVAGLESALDGWVSFCDSAKRAA